MHIASLILGIIAIITCFIPIFGAAVSLIALIIAIAAMCIKRPNNEGKGMKIAGLVLSIIAFLISLFITVIPSVLLISNLDTDLIEGAMNELGNISQALQNQLVQSFDGKTMSGADVLATCRQYQHSDTISVKIIVDKDKEFNIGKYNTKISDTVKQTLTEAKESAVNVTVIGENTSPNSLTEIQSQDGVNASQIYYSYVMKNPTTGDVIGIIFVKKDWNKENTDNKDNNVQNNEQSSSNNNENANNNNTNNSGTTSNNNNSNNSESNEQNKFLNNLNNVSKDNFYRVRVGKYGEYADATNFKLVENIKSIMTNGSYTKMDTNYVPTIQTITIYTNFDFGIFISVDDDNTIYAVISGSGYDVWKVTGVDSKQITNIIDSVQLESNTKEQELINSFAGKKMSGREVLAVVKQYENSDDISVKIKTETDKWFDVGYYLIGWMENPENGVLIGSVTGKNIYEPDTYNTVLNDEDGVKSSQTYYSYLVTDGSNIIGIYFVREGIEI